MLTHLRIKKNDNLSATIRPSQKYLGLAPKPMINNYAQYEMDLGRWPVELVLYCLFKWTEKLSSFVYGVQVHVPCWFFVV